MPKTSDMRDSKFLKKEDIGAGALVTIASCIQKNTAKEDEDPLLKWCLTFAELDKPLVLNATNIQVLEQMLASDDTDDWVGKQIVLYTDPNVMYAGKIVGGIRVRAPKKPKVASKAAPVHPPATGDMTDDDIPF